MLDAPKEIHVQITSLLISLCLLNDLLLELLPLNKGIIELSIGINELLPVNEHLEPLSHALLGPMILGQRTHDLRMVDQKSGGVALHLDILGNQLIEQSGCCPGSRAAHLELLAELVQKQSWLLALETLRHFDTQNPLEFLDD